MSLATRSTLHVASPEILANIDAAKDHQECIDAHFAASAEYWTNVYEAESLEGTIYKQRRSVVLEWVQKLGLPTRSRILEIGCGSGSTSIQLAQEGYTIQAVDSVDAMVER